MSDPVTLDHPTAATLYELGLPVRRAVLGDAHVERSMAGANDFMMVAQRAATEIGWGYVWARPGLDRRTRSLMNLAMLMALRSTHELQVHVRGAINNGVTVDEIREALLQAAVYCGLPAALEAFRAANAVLVADGHLTDGHVAGGAGQ